MIDELRARLLGGGAQWYDYQLVENERLIVALAAAQSAESGALQGTFDIVVPA